MKKALLPLAIIAALPMAAAANTSVTVYGRAHVSVDYLDNGASYGETNMSSNSSRLGFKASHEFDGITAIMQIEQQVDFDSGNANASNRDTYVGLKGDFGTVKLGRFDTPFKKARGPANLFGDQLGDMRNITRVGNARFDERNFNTIQYDTPKFGDFQLSVAYSLASNSQTKGDDVDDDSLSLALNYASGPLSFAAAYETYADDSNRGERDGFRVAAGFQATSDLLLVGFFQTIDHDVNDALDSEVYGFGAEYKLTSKARIKGHYMLRDGDVDETDAALFTVGLEYRIASPLRLYANYGIVDNDDNIALNPYTQARTTSDVPAVNGEKAKGFSLGMRYDF